MRLKQLANDCIRLIILAGVLTLLIGCAGGLQPVQSPAEVTPPPSEAASWQTLAQVRQDDWFHVLNLGSEALDWRLRAIDSAIDSIDLQTFIWDLEGSGALIHRHLLAAAERGVFVRILVDDSFILDADQALLDMDRHPGIELKVFNPYKRRSSDVALRQTLNMGEFHRLDHRMRIAFENAAVGECSGVAFVRVADDVLLVSRRLAYPLPLQSGREPGTTPSAKP